MGGQVKRRNEPPNLWTYIPALESKTIVYVVTVLCLIFVSSRWGCAPSSSVSSIDSHEGTAPNGVASAFLVHDDRLIRRVAQRPYT